MPQSTVEKFPELRGRVSVKRDGKHGPMLIIRRGPVSWAAVGITALLPIALLAWSWGRYLVNPDDTDAEVSLFLFSVCPGLPVALWAVNMWRRRTVLSSQGIEMRRLLLTERRPWPATSAGLTISERSVDNWNHVGKDIERYRIALVGSGHDDLVRLPGAVFDGSFRYSAEKSKKEAHRVRDAIWAFAVQSGWAGHDPRLLPADPVLAQATRGEGRFRAHRSSTHSLVYRTPPWPRIWETLCDVGLFLVLLGAAFIAGGIGMLLDADGLSSDALWALLALVLGLISWGYCAYRLWPCVGRTVIDAKGIRARGRGYPWPRSRSGLYVAGDKVMMMRFTGRVVRLPGTGGAWGGFSRRRAVAAAQCEEIWQWGLAHGSTHESGVYTPARDESEQHEREVFESLAGLRRP